MIFGAPRAERFKPLVEEEVSLADQEGEEALKELEDFFRLEERLEEGNQYDLEEVMWHLLKDDPG